MHLKACMMWTPPFHPTLVYFMLAQQRNKGGIGIPSKLSPFGQRHCAYHNNGSFGEWKKGKEKLFRVKWLFMTFFLRRKFQFPSNIFFFGSTFQLQ